jgi:hypothetical protein
MNLKDSFLGLNNYFSPKIIGEVNDQYIKVPFRQGFRLSYPALYKPAAKPRRRKVSLPEQSHLSSVPQDDLCLIALPVCNQITKLPFTHNLYPLPLVSPPFFATLFAAVRMSMTTDE